MKLRDLFAVILPIPLLLGAVRDFRAEHVCYRECHSCLRSCERGDKRCRQMCFQMKRNCCRSCPDGKPGPARSCTCR